MDGSSQARTGCERLPEYVDGDLGDDEVRAMVVHLADCLACQTALDELLQFDAIGRSVVPGAALVDLESVVVAAPVVGSPRSPWVGRAAAAAVLLTVGAGAPPLVEALRYDSDQAIVELLAYVPAERVDVRVYGGPLDAYRRYAPELAAEPTKGAPLPAAAIGRLEAHHRQRAIAALYLFEGSPERAAAYLDALAWSPDVGSDRAAIHIARGENEHALDLLDRVLTEVPEHERAHFNRALALRALGLTHQAARAFERAAELGSGAWAAEATRRADDLLASIEPWRTAWFGVFEAGERWISDRVPIPDDLIDRVPGLSRFYFYAAVRSAESVDEINKLRSVASRLEAQHGDHALTRYLDRVALQDFRVRAPLARTFGALWAKELSGKNITAFIARLEKSPASDILFGTLYRTKRMNRDPERFASLATGEDDLWLQLVSIRVRAMAIAEHGHYLEAEALLKDGLRRSHFEYRTADLENALTRVYRELHLTAEAEQVGRRALDRTRLIGEWDQHSKLLVELANVAMYRMNFGAMRALIEESMAFWPHGKRTQRNGREYLAMRHIYLGDGAAAAKMMEGIEAPSTLGAWVLVDAFRFGTTSLTVEYVADRLARIRNEHDDPGRGVLAEMLEGRLRADDDPARAVELLNAAIQAAEQLDATDVNAQKARAHALLTLAMIAGSRGAFKDALTELARQVGAAVPDGCALGVAADDQRTLAVGRDHQGAFFGHYDKHGVDSTIAIDIESFVPAEVRDRLADCAAIDVFAHPPLAGADTLLPASMPWAYRLGPGSNDFTGQSGANLVVSNVMLTPDLDGRLPPLPPLDLNDRGPVLHLRREAATPTRVLEAMRHAGEIEFYTHGYLNLGVSDASMLALSRGADGRYAITAKDIEGQTLEGHPVVFLGACMASRTAPSHHATFSLPAAFLRAGARAVFASPRTIPANDVAQFFGDVRRMLRQGATPVEALRTVRMKRLTDEPKHWSQHILLFVG